MRSSAIQGLGWAAAPCAAVVLLAFRTDAAAGYRERGDLAVSVAVSAAHTATYGRKSETAVDYAYGDLLFTPQEAKGEDYTDVDLSVFGSLGYFVIDRLELGLSGTAMQTTYSGTDRTDFSLSDAQVYGKYFFKKGMGALTPYVKMRGGISRIDSGDYEESNTIVGANAGLEFFGMGPVTWFLEYSTDWTFLGGDIGGTEWRNQLYIGISWYLDVSKRWKRAEQTNSVLSGLDPETREQVREADKRWGGVLERADAKSAP